MSLQVLPNFPRGSLFVDPNYYSSNLFVDPLRADIQSLISTFGERYEAALPPRHAFSIFRQVWKEHGWDYVHLAVLEDIGRDVFVVNVLRLFLERINEKEDILYRMAALFGLYTFYLSQPTTSVRVQDQILIPIDIYKALPTMFQSAPADLSLYATHILSLLFERHAFLILPESRTSPYDPCRLPRWELQKAAEGKKKTGRKSKKDKGRAALEQVKKLEEMVVAGVMVPSQQETDKGTEYLVQKSLLLDSVSVEEVREAEQITLDRMRALDAQVEHGIEDDDAKDGLRRVEESVSSGAGLLGFVPDKLKAG